MMGDVNFSTTTSVTSRKMKQIVKDTHDLTMLKMVGLVIKIAAILFLSIIETLYLILSAVTNLLTLNKNKLISTLRKECCVIASMVSCVGSLARLCIMREPISIYLDAETHKFVYFNRLDQHNTNEKKYRRL